MEPPWIGGQHSRESHVRQDYQCDAGGGRNDRARPSGPDAKRPPTARRDSMRDKGRNRWSKRGGDDPLRLGAKDHHRHEDEPCPPIGDCKEDGERVPGSHCVQ